MSRAKQLFEQVQQAQARLGRGEVEEALAEAGPLRDRAVKMVADSRMTSFERTMAAAAATYATITLILGAAESLQPAESIPRIRGLALDTLGGRRGTETWKVVAAAAEMLARAGDAPGAVWAVRKARQLAPGEDYLAQLSGSIQSMYPQAFKDAPDDVPDEPPPPATSGRRASDRV